MKTVTLHVRRLGSCFIASLFTMAISVPISMLFSDGYVLSQDKEQRKPDTRKTKIIQSMRPDFAKRLQKAAELNEAEDMDGAMRELDTLKNRSLEKANETEKANLWQFYAFLYYQKDSPNEAIKAYKNLLAIPNVQEKAEALYVGSLYSLAQMYFLQEDYKSAVAQLERWFDITPEPGASSYVLLGQGYYQLDNYEKALPAIEMAIRVNTEKGKEVKENWYLLLRAMYYSKEDFDKTFDVLEILVQKFPKKQYYSQLSAMYGQLNKEFNQYSTIAAMHDADMLESSAEIVTYAQFLMQNDRPYKAGVVLEAGLDKKQVDVKEGNLKLLANAWMISREDIKSIPVLEEAAKLSEKGDTYASLGQSYLNIEKWDKALEAIDNAFKKGKLKRPGSAHMARGIAYLNKKSFGSAIKAFEAARKVEETRKQATQWKRFAEGERTRERALKS